MDIKLKTISFKGLVYFYQLMSWAKQTRLGKLSLIYCQLKGDLDGEKKRQM